MSEERDVNDETHPRDGAWSSRGEGPKVEIPRTITIHIVRTLLDEKSRVEFDEEIRHVEAYLLEAELVRWMTRVVAPAGEDEDEGVSDD